MQIFLQIIHITIVCILKATEQHCKDIFKLTKFVIKQILICKQVFKENIEQKNRVKMIVHELTVLKKNIYICMYM